MNKEKDNLKKTYKTKINEISLPELKFSGRLREFNYYSEEMKAKVIIEHIINGRTHRWIDENVLGEKNGKTNGRNSANVLYYLGMKADYRGIFKNYRLSDVIEVLSGSKSDYSKVVALLELYRQQELERVIKSDIEIEELGEGIGLEGRTKYFYGKRYERNAKNRRLAIETHGFSCHACEFNFEKVYGERGKDFIEIHHINPLSKLEKEELINPVTDLVPLCANCHRMIHRKKGEVLSVIELKEIIKNTKV